MITTTKHVTTKILQQSGVTDTTPVSRTLLTLFKSFECMQIPSPDPGKNLASIPRSKLRPEFNEGIENSIKYILSLIHPRKGMGDKTELDGILLSKLAEDYVQELNKPDCIPNLTVSYENAVQAHIRELANNLTFEYNEEMQLKMASHKVPFEEGDLESFTIPSDTLFTVHRYIYQSKYKILRQEIDKYMAGSSFSEAREQLLITFQEKIIKCINNRIEDSCCLHTYIIKNRENSEVFCIRIFNQEYQKLANDVNTETLEKRYLAQAIGPAKQKVLQSKLLEIPASPADFSEFQIGVNSMVVTWTVNEQRSVNYEVKIVREDAKAQLIQVRTDDKPPVTLLDLTPNTRYHLQIRACGLEYKGMYSQPLIITTLAGKPGKPEKPKIEIESPTKAKVIIKRLSCEDLHGADLVDSVVLESAFEESMGWDKVTVAEREKPQSIPITKHVTLPSLPSDHDSIYYRVRMKTIGGESVSDVEELSILRFIPGPLINPIRYFHDPEERKAVISWDPPNINRRSIKFYDIQCQQEDADWRTYKECPDSTSITLTNLLPATCYSIELKARNYDLVHGECAVLKFKTKPAKPAQPNIPQIHIDPENISKAYVYITRLSKEDENGSPISSITVQKAVGEFSNWSDEKHDFPKGDRPFKLIVDLFNATEKKKHYFRVIMVNEAGKSDPSQYCEMEYSQLIPGVPSNVSADHKTNNSITLKWDPPLYNPMSVDYYIVKMQEHGKNEWKRLSAPRDIHRKDKMFTAPNLRQNCTYNFHVIAFNKDNECAMFSEANIVSATTQPCRPNKPDFFAIKIEIINSSTARIFVKKPSLDETGSNITSLIVKKCSEDHKLISDEEINCEDCKDEIIIRKTIAINAQIGYIRICLRNEHGTSPESDPVGVSAHDVTPGPPILHEVKEKDIDVRSINLVWNRPVERGQAAKQYQIEVSSDNKNPLWTTVPYLYTVNEYEHKGRISNLIPKTKYCFRMYALNGVLKSAHSNIITIETLAGRPDKPQPPKISQLDGDPSKACVMFSRLEQNKENGSPVTSVKIEYMHEQLVHWTQIGKNRKLNSEMSRQTSTFDIDLPNIEERKIQWLSFRIKMINDVDESEASEAVPIRVIDLQPGTVEELCAVKTAYHQVTLAWKTPKTHPAIIVNYIIEIKELESDGWKDYIRLNPDKTKCLIKNLQCSHVYQFRVSAVSRSTKGPYQEIEVVTPDLPPKPPLHLRADKKWSDAVKIRWGKPAGDPKTNDAYRIVVKKGIKEMQRCYTRGYSKTIKDLNSFTTYNIEVAGVSKSIKFSTGNPSISVTTAVSGTARVAWTVVGSVALGPVGGIAAHQGLKPDDKSHRIDSDTECEAEFVEKCEKVYRQIQCKRRSKQTAQTGKMAEPRNGETSTGMTVKQVSSASSGACGSSIKQPAKSDVKKSDQHAEGEQKLQQHIIRDDKLKHDDSSRKKAPKPASETSQV